MSVFVLSTRVTRVTRVTSRTARVTLVRMCRRFDLLDYSNPHLTKGYSDSRWQKDENKNTLSQKDNKQSVNDTNFMLFVPNYAFVSTQTPFVFVLVNLKKENSPEPMFYLLFGMNFGERFISLNCLH